MKKKVLLYILAVLSVLCCVFMLFACDESSKDPSENPSDQHTCTFDREVAESEFLKTPATCETLAVYYYSCECGKSGNKTFEYGDFAPHDLSRREGSPASCTQNGEREHWHCLVCGRNFADSEGGELLNDIVINAAHRAVLHEIKEATCSDSGVKQEYYSCSECGKYFSKLDCLNEINVQELEDNYIEPKLQHNIMQFFAGEPTCTDAGSKRDFWYCFECKTMFSDADGKHELLQEDYEQNYYIAKIPHSTEYHAPTPATCLHDGVKKEYWTCGACGGFFADEAAESEISKDIIDEYISIKIPHSMTVEEGISPDCEHSGILPHCYCSLCEKYYTDESGTTELESIIAPPYHNVDKNNSQPATCIMPLRIEYWKCWKCNRMFRDRECLQPIESEDDLYEGSPDTSNHIGWQDNVCSGCSYDAGGTKGLKYTFKDEAYVLSGKGSFTSGEVIIPAVYNGYPVVGISDNAFKNCTGLTSISIPTSVTSIGSSAFEGCTGLNSIKLPDSLKSIGYFAFRGCVGFNSINLPTGLESVGSMAFYECDNLNAVHVKTLEAFMAIAFDGSDSNPLVYAGNLYVNGALLTHLIIPEGTTAIGRNAFTGANCIREITFASTLESIGNSAFSNCDGITELNLPSGLTEICDFAFSECANLGEIVIPNGVITLKQGAFRRCISALSLHIPASLTQITAHSFAGCISLEAITVDGDNAAYKSVDNCLLSKDGSTLVLGCKTGVIPSSVSEIGDYAFTGNTAITSVHISKNVTYISGDAFDGCLNLIEINYDGTCDEWVALEKGYEWAPELWNRDTGEYIVYCSDGTVAKDDTITRN